MLTLITGEGGGVYTIGSNMMMKTFINIISFKSRIESSLDRDNTPIWGGRGGGGTDLFFDWIPPSFGF